VYALCAGDAGRGMETLLPDKLQLKKGVQPFIQGGQMVDLVLPKRDFFCVLYAKTPLNIVEIQQKIAAATQKMTFVQAIEKVLQTQIVDNQTIALSDKNGITSKDKKRNILPIFVATRQYD
jgi:hypothetical protein